MRKIKEEPFKDIRNYINYNHENGEFTWRISRNRKVKVGSIAGCIKRGIRVIKFNNRDYIASRLAWFFHYGEFPNGDVTHINGDRLDNSICNLSLSLDHKYKRKF